MKRDLFKARYHKWKHYLTLYRMVILCCFGIALSCICLNCYMKVDRVLTDEKDFSEKIAPYRYLLEDEEFRQFMKAEDWIEKLYILSSEGDVIYSGSVDVLSPMEAEQLSFIKDNVANRRFKFYQQLKDDRDEITYCQAFGVSLIEGEEILILGEGENKEQPVMRYCLLEHDRNILEGDLFGSKTSLSDEELALLVELNEKQKRWDAMEYLSRDGEERILVAMSGEQSRVDRNDSRTINRYVIEAGCQVLLILILSGTIFAYSFRRGIRPIDDAIAAYESGSRVDEQTVDEAPVEIRGVLRNFAELEKELDRSREETVTAHNNYRRVMAELAHDIRTPLSVVHGYSAALSDGVIPEEKRNDVMEVIRQRTEEMVVLTDTLLEYSKSVHPDYNPVLEVIDLTDLLRQYLGKKYEELWTRNIQLDADIPEFPVMVTLDRSCMMRILENLFGNSVKYSIPGMTICCHLKAEKDTAILRIGDNGQGIPEEVRRIVFEPFAVGKQDKLKSGVSQTGLGLAIVRNLVEAQAGTIELEADSDDTYRTVFVMKFGLSSETVRTLS